MVGRTGYEVPAGCGVSSCFMADVVLARRSGRYTLKIAVFPSVAAFYCPILFCFFFLFF